MQSRWLGLALCTGLVVVVALSAAGSPEPEVQLSANVIRQMQLIAAEKAARTPAQNKIDSQLLEKSRTFQGIPSIIPEDSLIRSSIQVSATGETLVDIKARVNRALLDRVRELGGSVVSSFPRFHSVRASLPIDRMEDLAAMSQVAFIRPAEEPITNKVMSQGDITHRADLARSSLNAKGSGITVGVLSDSIESLATLQAAGNLPPNCPAGPPCVTVISGQAGSGSSEGTAMMEIVNSLAPMSNLGFATGFGGQANMANNILALKAAGAKVIVDDLTYYAEPAFQDGPIAQAVNTVVANGAIYFSSAGNDGNKRDGTSGVWEGNYVGTSLPAPLQGLGYVSALDFGGANSDIITANPSTRAIALQWSDALGASSNDYDLFMLDPAGSQVVLYSNNPQSGTQDPVEFIGYDQGSATNYKLVVALYSGQPRFMHLQAFRGRLQYNTKGATFGHNAAQKTVTLAAVSVWTAGCPSCVPFVGSTTNPVETFSSDGPRRIFYNPNGTAITPGNFLATGGLLLSKPDLAAADGVTTATPGFDPFYGTSAAAPHAAAIAALALSKKPSLTPAALEQIMASTALPSENPGPDSLSGAGITDAYSAVSAAASGTATPTSTATRTATPTPTRTGTPTATPTSTPTPTPVPAALSFSPRSVNHPPQILLGHHSSTSKPRIIRLINAKNRRQSAPITISGIGTDNPEFKASQNCLGNLAAGASCQVSVTFTPSQQGSRTGNLRVNSNANNPAVNIPLRGTGKMGNILISPRTVNFGRVASASPAHRTVKLTNRNPVPMEIGPITSGNPQFQPSGCANSEIASMGSCTVTVTFVPAGVGTQKTTLTIANDAAGNPHAVNLVGVGR